MLTNGQRHYGPTLPTSAAAADYARSWRANPTAKSATLQDCFDALMREAELHSLRPATMTCYRNHWRIVTGPMGWGPEVPVCRITVDQVERYVAARKAADISVSTIWTKEVWLLRYVLRLAFRKGMVSTDPLAGVESPKIRKQRFPALSEDEVQNIIRSLRNGGGRHAERDADLLTLVAGTGLRRAEVARLRPQDVSLETRTIRVDGKTGFRTIPIGKSVEPVLRRMLLRAGSNKVLVGTEDMIERVFLRAKGKVGEPRLTPHVLRHSFATMLARKGVSPYVLMGLLGHANLGQTSHYYHAQGDQQRQAVDSLLPQEQSEPLPPSQPAEDPPAAAPAT